MSERAHCARAAEEFYDSNETAADWIQRERDQARKEIEAKYWDLLQAARGVIEAMPLPIAHRPAKAYRALRACISRFTN